MRFVIGCNCTDYIFVIKKSFRLSPQYSTSLVSVTQGTHSYSRRLQALGRKLRFYKYELQYLRLINQRVPEL